MEMEKSHPIERKTTDSKDSGQISFNSINREAALDMLERTNIEELSDAECRELLRDMTELIK